MKDAM